MELKLNKFNFDWLTTDVIVPAFRLYCLDFRAKRVVFRVNHSAFHANHYASV